MIGFVAGAIVGLAIGVVAAALIAWQWHSTVRDEIYEQGVQHGRERERLGRHSQLLDQRLHKGA